MILLDSDVVVMERRYRKDPRFSRNRQALQQIVADGIPLGVTTQVLLEVAGILSFNVSPAQVANLPHDVVTALTLKVLPDLLQYPDYAGCTVNDLVTQMGKQMALADAVQAVQIAHFASTADCLLTWNARHFRGKLAIPVLTPEEWLNQRLSSTP